DDLLARGEPGVLAMARHCAAMAGLGHARKERAWRAVSAGLDWQDQVPAILGGIMLETEDDPEMRNTIATALLAATALAGPARADVLETMGPILATAPDAATLNAKCDRYVAAIERHKTALEGETGAATIDGTLARYDALTALIGAGSGEFTLYQQVMADQERRDAGAACQVRLATLGSEISLSRPIYDRLKAIDASGADDATEWYLSRTLSGFERSGVALDDARRAHVQELNEK